jgi:hypothetical protein
MAAHLQEKHLIDKNGLIEKRKHEASMKSGELAEQV